MIGARAALAEAGFSGSKVEVVPVFDASCHAGARVMVEAVGEALCVLFAPGGSMVPDSQDTMTDIRVEIETNAALAGKAPPPFATPKQDIRIDAATAKAYRVASGDYIRIIDVDGRQCSDFLAFDAAALAHGEEFGLDHTTIHTLMGSAYPGHSNCTDNFNAALKPYGVAPHMGWPAINFFFNTFVDEQNQIGMDSPWSRPGDYVLVRALTDLVCAFSSCADDIDPAKGWLPTDIHFCVYDASCHFSKGIAHCMTPEAEPRLTRESGYHTPATRSRSGPWVNRMV